MPGPAPGDLLAGRVGTWLYSPEGSLVRGEKDGVVAFNEVGRRNRDRGSHYIHLVPPGAWWFAVWADDGNSRSVAIDVCVPLSESKRTAALAVVGELGTRITGYDPLFDDTGRKHLAEACKLSLPPLRNLP